MSRRSVRIHGGDDNQGNPASDDTAKVTIGQLHVRLVDADGNVAKIDATNDALVVQDEIHTKIHSGELFTCGASAEVASGGVVEFLIRVTGGTHARFIGSVAHNMKAELFEDPTTSADGTAVACTNRNRFSSNTATTLVFAGPTVTGDGTRLVEFFIPGGDKQSAGGGLGQSFEEWILSPGDYLVRISNNILNPASAGWAGLTIDFYE